MSDSSTWGDEDVSGFEWDDDVVDKCYKDYNPPKKDLYYSVLDMYRDKGREDFKVKAATVPFTSPNKDKVCKRPDTGAPLSKSWVESSDKQRASANQTYRDFLLHKRAEVSIGRMEEFKDLSLTATPEQEECHSLGERSLRDTMKQGERRKSFGDEHTDKGGDLDKLLDEGPIQWDFEAKEKVCIDDPEKEEREAKINYLVEDQYYPGLIDDAVNRKVDFHQVAFDISFGPDSEPPVEAPADPPISLIEAFDIRVGKEQGARKKIMKQTPAPPPDIDTPGNEDMAKSFLSFLKDLPRQTRVINREEVVLANAVDVELTTLVRNKPVNELTKAINSLQKAEIMNEYDKSLQAAEEAYFKAPPELAESAAVHKATTFITEELSKKNASVQSGGSYRPIEIVSYMGITRPIIQAPGLRPSRIPH